MYFNMLKNKSLCHKNHDQETLKKIICLNFLKFLEKNNVAYDIGSYRDAPSGIRIWGGATVNYQDIDILLDWLEWGYHEYIKKEI